MEQRHNFRDLKTYSSRNRVENLLCSFWKAPFLDLARNLKMGVTLKKMTKEQPRRFCLFNTETGLLAMQKFACCFFIQLSITKIYLEETSIFCSNLFYFLLPFLKQKVMCIYIKENTLHSLLICSTLFCSDKKQSKTF